MLPENGGHAGLETRRRRIIYRAWHRGTRELDLLLGRFADAQVSRMDAAALDRFETLMNLPEPTLMAVLTGIADAPGGIDAALVSRIAAFHAANPVAKA